MAAPKKQQLAGSGIALCGMAWGLLFFAAIFIAGALQQSIETDAAQYIEYASAGCTGTVLLNMEFGKDSGCQQIMGPNSQKLFVKADCGVQKQQATISVCTDATCGSCTTTSAGLFQNCTTGGPVYAGKSATINCVNHSQSLQAGVGIFSTLVIALAAILALFLMADLHETVKKYVPWLDFTADQASERERASLNGDYQLVEHA